MALKFLNKKGWHTGSLRNIENVWKAEQKHEAEQRKLEELRKQIQEEKERAEFRQLQEQAGLVPRQERLEFLYDSGLSVGRSSDADAGFKAFEALPSQPNNEITVSSSSSAPAKQESVPGALFEEKPHSANDAWRKLHTDPLLMIRQREQDALARIKNNPVKMAMIRKSIETKKDDKADKGQKQDSKRRKHKKHSSSRYQSDSEGNGKTGSKERNKELKNRKSDHHEHPHYSEIGSEENLDERRGRHRDSHRGDSRAEKQVYFHDLEDSGNTGREERNKESKNRKSDHHHHRNHSEDGKEQKFDETGGRHRDSHRRDSRAENHRGRSPVESRKQRESDRYNRQTKRCHEQSKPEGHAQTSHRVNSNQDNDSRYSAETKNGRDLDPHHRRRNAAPKLSEEERVARLREMQRDAELHEEQRWKRLKKADDDDAKEATRSVTSSSRSFLDVAQKTVYGAEKGGSATIEESIRRRSHYLQGRTSTEGNAFRR